MAKVEVFRALDMFDFDPEFHSTVRVNRSKYIAEGTDGRDDVTVVGRGTFDKNLSGPIRSVDVDLNDKDLYKVSDMDVRTDDTFGLPYRQQVELTLSGNDHVTGSRRGDVLSGFDGNDIINGRGGKDVLFGADGRDQISGGDRADELWGGDDRDVLTGGRGADLFVLSDADAVDKITDFFRVDTLGFSTGKGSDFRGLQRRDIDIVERGDGFNILVDDDQVARVLCSNFTMDDIVFV